MNCEYLSGFGSGVTCKVCGDQRSVPIVRECPGAPAAQSVSPSGCCGEGLKAEPQKIERVQKAVPQKIRDDK